MTPSQLNPRGIDDAQLTAEKEIKAWREIVPHLDRLLKNDDFTWLWKTVIIPKCEDQLRKALDLKATPEERTAACQLYHSLNEIVAYPGRQFEHGRKKIAEFDRTKQEEKTQPPDVLRGTQA